MLKSKNLVKKLTMTLFALVSVFGVGLTNVNAETTNITEIKLTGNYEYGKVPAGILPSFNPETTTEGTSIDNGNSYWAKRESSTSMWGGFAGNTPVAYNDGKTIYGYTFRVVLNDGYQFDYSALKVIYNGKDVTSTSEVTTRYTWGAYVDVDLGKATGENPTIHTVTFNSNGGSEITPIQVVSGLKIKEPTPTKDKYIFRGWYEEATLNTKFDFNNTPITSNMNLYAKWEAANSINEIILVGDVQNGNVPVGTLPSFNPRTTTDSITIDERNSYWVKRESTTSLWGGFAGNTPVAYNDGKTNYGYNFRVVPKDGYQLDYSTLKVIYNGEDVTLSAEVTKGYDWGSYVTIDLGKANGTPVVYTVTFNSNEGTPVASQNINAGEKVQEPTAPTKKGFTFGGWYEDATFRKEFDFNTPIANTMILYAKWIENKYTVTFDTKGGNTIAPATVKEGEKVSEPTTAPTREGFTFDGWYTDDAYTTKYNFENAVTKNITLYAKWNEVIVPKYTLTFNSNSGTGSMTPIANLTGEYTLPKNEFISPSGKQFKGWSLTADGAIITKIDMTENKTVYAIWEDIIYSYEFLENTGEQTIDQKTNSFKIVIDADETKFVSLAIDGVLYKKDVDYTVKHGSTIIEFTSNGLAKLNALSKGEHNVTVTFTDEVINGKINVTTVNSPIIPQNPDIDNPQTYDGIFTYMTMFVVSILGLITSVIIGIKRTRTN